MSQKSIAACCYTCVFSYFPKRHANRVTRAAGICFEAAGDLDLPRKWTAPDEFWNLVRDGVFPVDDFDRFQQECAALLFGHAYLLGHMTQEELQVEYERLNAIARHWTQIEPVTWLQTCPHHRFSQGETQSGGIHSTRD